MHTSLQNVESGVKGLRFFDCVTLSHVWNTARAGEIMDGFASVRWPGGRRRQQLPGFLVGDRAHTCRGSG